MKEFNSFEIKTEEYQYIFGIKNKLN